MAIGHSILESEEYITSFSFTEECGIFYSAIATTNIGRTFCITPQLMYNDELGLMVEQCKMEKLDFDMN